MTNTAINTAAEFVVVILLLVLLACPICAAIVAHSKGRAAFDWFMLGLIFGPFGLLAITGMPTAESRAVRRARQGKDSSMKICPYCIEPVRVEASVCSHCCNVVIDQLA